MARLLGLSGNKTLKLKPNEALEIVRGTEVTYEGLAVSAKFFPGYAPKGTLKSQSKNNEDEGLLIKRLDGSQPQHFYVDSVRIVPRDAVRDEAQRKKESEEKRYQETHPKGVE